MNWTTFQETVAAILAVELPPGDRIVTQGRKLAHDIKIGRTAFMQQMGVASEAAFKRQCIRDQRITYHAHIGMSSWSATTRALRYLDDVSRQQGFRIHRAGICLDRRMGLPPEHRREAPAETGPMLDSDADWQQVGALVPIQPHMGDFMIGFPAATHNTVKALQAGVTTIGNLSQFFSHEIPTWRDPVATTVETVRAMALMGALCHRGTLMHSYLEDGLGALFYDCATVAGWAILERYIVEDLLGGKLAHCIGGLTTDPVKRAGWVFALNDIHAQDCLGSMIYGDTISFCEDFNLNRAIVAEYLLWDIMAQLECPTGHAVLSLPVTEALRVPSAEEIAEAQRFGRRIETTARRLRPHVDFGDSRAFARQVVAGGRAVFQAAMDGLSQAGVDVNDPVQLLYVLKKLGPAAFESMFAAGPPDSSHARGHKAIVPTDVFEMSARCIDTNLPAFQDPRLQEKFRGRRLLIASTDVHEHAIMVIQRLLAEAGAEIINMGAEINPQEIAETARRQSPDAILISTHNGLALEYAQRLKAALGEQIPAVPVIMGGILNQKFEHQELPVGVSTEIRALGYTACPRLGGEFVKMLEFSGLNPEP